MSERELPGPDEVAAELERICSSKTFHKHPTLARLLTEIVVGELGNRPPTEYDLGIRVFGKKADWNPTYESVVRMNVSLLKDVLPSYYAAEGVDDVVEITLPARGRRPTFSYNPDRHAPAVLSAIEADWKANYLQLSSRFGVEITRRLVLLIEQDPSYFPAYLFFADLLLICAACDAVTFPAKTCVTDAEMLINKCLEINNELWEAHVIAGAIHCCGFKWDLAEASFGKAKKLNADGVKMSFWYRCYLLAMFRLEELESCQQLVWKTQRNLRMEPAVTGLFRYVLGDYEWAGDSVRDVMNWDKVGDAFAYWTGATLPFGDTWIINILQACVDLEVRSSSRAKVYAKWGVDGSQVFAFYGVLIAAHVKLSMGGRYEKELRMAEDLFYNMTWSDQIEGSMSRVISHMALDRFDEAVEALRTACRNRNPLAVFMHVWPILDPLRERDDFKSLISEMNLPSGIDVLALQRRAEKRRQVEEKNEQGRRNLEKWEKEHPEHDSSLWEE